MPSRSRATSRIGRLVADCEISISDLGATCWEAGIAADPSNEGEMKGGSGGPETVQVNLALAARAAVFAHSPASSFLPSAGCTRVTLKRPSAQTTVKPSASTATISPSLPAIPLGSLAGSGLASKIFNCWPASVVQAPGAGLQPRINRSICSQGLPQSISALSGPQRPS